MNNLLLNFPILWNIRKYLSKTLIISLIINIIIFGLIYNQIYKPALALTYYYYIFAIIISLLILIEDDKGTKLTQDYDIFDKNQINPHIEYLIHFFITTFIMLPAIFILFFNSSNINKALNDIENNITSTIIQTKNKTVGKKNSLQQQKSEEKQNGFFYNLFENIKESSDKTSTKIENILENPNFPIDKTRKQIFKYAILFFVLFIPLFLVSSADYKFNNFWYQHLALYYFSWGLSIYIIISIDAISNFISYLKYLFVIISIYAIMNIFNYYFTNKNFRMQSYVYSTLHLVFLSNLYLICILEFNLSYLTLFIFFFFINLLHSPILKEMAIMKSLDPKE